jgi:hypothetical protein
VPKVPIWKPRYFNALQDMTRQHFDIPHDSAFFIAIGGFGGERCWAKQAGRVPREIRRICSCYAPILL